MSAMGVPYRLRRAKKRLQTPIDDQLGNRDVKVAFGLFEESTLGEGPFLVPMGDDQYLAGIELLDLIADRLYRVRVSNLTRHLEVGIAQLRSHNRLVDDDKGALGVGLHCGQRRVPRRGPMY